MYCRFILLAPKDKDHYNPILCLKQSLLTIVERSSACTPSNGCAPDLLFSADYLTPDQRSLFGTLPNNNLLATDDEHPTRSPTPSDGDSQTFRLPRLACFEAHPPSVNYLKTLQRAITRQDGPLFMKTMTSINAILRILKYPPLPDDPLLPPGENALKEYVKKWSPTGMPKDVSLRLIEETYQRCVGPRVNTLRNYEAFSSETYGELMPSLVADIINRTGLHEDSLFLDLGCGVGNVVLQASLQTGCRSFGIEIMPAPAGIAREQLEELKNRTRMWGVSMGSVELEEGDMLKSERVARLMSEADVVLINNKVFKESRESTRFRSVSPRITLLAVNESIRPKFLDLKEGAVVVSLKPFVPVNARLTERNVRRFYEERNVGFRWLNLLPRSTISAQYSMLHRGSTTLGVSRGGAGEDTTTSTGSTERGMSRFDRNWRVGGRRGPGDDTDVRMVSGLCVSLMIPTDERQLLDLHALAFSSSRRRSRVMVSSLIY